MAVLWRGVETALLGQRGHLFPWAPVLLACGIGLFFALRVEPPVALLWAAGAAGASGLLALRRAGAVLGPALAAGALVALGFALAGARTHSVSGPVLDFRYYGAVEGRIVGIDRSASDAVRLTLDRVVLSRVDPDETPLRVRISLHSDAPALDPRPGATILATGHLGPPSGAVEPGGFDFRRHAWFLSLGAVGYTRKPVLLLEPPGAGQAVFKARMWFSDRVQRLLPGETGAFAAAVTTGDRSGMGQQTLQALRDTNLAHLLAISGLHMGLLAGFVFGAIRVALLLVPWTRHRWPVKKIAAVGALACAFVYLLLSGGNVATERAFTMVAVALCALMLDRRALSLRGVALAALVILVWQPESLLSPGFQMSFAATTALVVSFERIAHFGVGRALPRWTGMLFTVVASSFVAELATLPVAMAHFNRLGHYGLIANIVSVPVMSLFVVPFAVLAALLLPFGLDWIALRGMGLGLDWILFVAREVASWDGAVRHIPAPGGAVLPLIAFGALVLALWQGWARWIGALPMALAAAALGGASPSRVARGGNWQHRRRHDRGRPRLSRPRGSGFIAEVWLENDGSGDRSGPRPAAGLSIRIASPAAPSVRGRSCICKAYARRGPFRAAPTARS